MNPAPGKIRILVTGANGQLGKELQLWAKDNDHFQFTFTTREELPVQDAAKVDELMQSLQPQYLVNCAAYTAVDNAEDEREKARLINGDAPGILAAACKQHSCTFIHISTDYVFNGEGSRPYTETDATGPVSVYGLTKLAGEEQAMQHNPSTVIIRTSWVYSQFGKNFVKTMLKLMSERESINVVNDQQGSPTWAAGLAKAIMHLVNCIHSGKNISGIYHYCDGGITNWHAFAMAIKEKAGLSCIVNPIPSSAYPTRAKRPSWSALDTTKIAATGVEILPWKTQLDHCIDQIIRNGSGS